jgi:hypothetical protein
MMNRLFVLALSLLLASPALAEHVGGLGTLTLPSGATFDGTKIHVTDAWGKRITKTDPTILPNHVFKYSLTLANVTAGTAVVSVNGVTTGCTGAGWVTSPNGYHGEFDIADNFTTANAIVSAATRLPDPPFTNHLDDREPDPNGSFRYAAAASVSKHAADDPMVCPGQPGRSHLHMFWGNQGVNAYSTYRSLRTTGGTNIGHPRYPGQRSAIWQPDMLDGADHILPPDMNLEYYKTIPPSLAACLPPGTDPATYSDSDTAHVGICIPLPNGLRWLGGCNMTKLMAGTHPNGCLNETTVFANGTYNAGYNFACRSAFRTPDVVGGVTDPRYSSLDEALASGRCTPGRYLYYTLLAQNCWNGHDLDSPNHQDHMSYTTGGVALVESGTVNRPTSTGLQPRSGVGDTMSPGSGWGKCPATHPYQIPGFSIQEAWKIDGNFAHWHLSCDENMNMSFPRATCGHMDYWEAWSPIIKDKWQKGCIEGRNSGNSGLLCDGTLLAFAGGATPAAMGYDPNSDIGAAETVPLKQFLFRNRVGFGREITGNGTVTGELRSVSGGELSIEVVGGFTGDITAFTIVDVTPVGKHNGVGPLTTN